MYFESKENRNTEITDKKNKLRNRKAIYNLLELKALIAHETNESLNLLHLI